MAAIQSPEVIVNEAFQKLRDSVSVSNAMYVQQIDLKKDVLNAIGKILASLHNKHSARELSRIRPFLDVLGEYATFLKFSGTG